MISESFQEDVFIADFTEYNNTPGLQSDEFFGVTVGTKDYGVVPSFVVTDKNRVTFVVINNEKNLGFYTLPDNNKVPQCECIIHTDRHDNRKGWMLFLELKYCKPRNLYSSMLDGINQLRATCNYVLKTKQEFDASQYKKYLVISTPGVEPLDPFDASYFDQDYMLTVKEDTGAVLKAANSAHIQTPAVVVFK